MWNALIKELPGIDIRTVQNPSSAPVPPQELGDMYDDANTIRAAVENVGGPVVVCAHSYGAVPASQGLAGVSAVKRLVYLTPFMLDVGESLLSSVGGTPPDFWGMEHAADGYTDMLRAEEIFYPDLDPETAAQAAAGLGPQSISSLEQPLTQAAWHSIPSTFVIGTKDLGAPFYQHLAKRAQRVRSLESAHSPFLSRPADTAALLRQELAEAAMS
jgi:pimeloyl-ACP methyl ester carboxylesterase